MDADSIARAAPWATAEDLAALGQGLRDARRDWAEIRLPVEVFVEHVRARWQAAPDAGRSAERVRDLYLACACATGDAGALQRFDVEVLGAAMTALRRMRRGDDFIDEALQRAREHLLVGGAHGPRIAGYGGVGSLAGWARVVVVRLALRMIREGGAGDDTTDEALPDPAAPNVERRQIQDEYGTWLKQCIEDALVALDAGDRALLDLLFREQMSMAEAGAKLGVDKSTISRRVTAIRTRVFDGLQRRARDELRLGGTEYASLVGQLRSQLDISLGVLGRR